MDTKRLRETYVTIIGSAYMKFHMKEWYNINLLNIYEATGSIETCLNYDLCNSKT